MPQGARGGQEAMMESEEQGCRDGGPTLIITRVSTLSSPCEQLLVRPVSGVLLHNSSVVTSLQHTQM